MASDQARRAARSIYDQLVAARARTAMGLWLDPDFATGEGERFRALSARLRAMPPPERAIIGEVAEQVAADTLLDLLHVVAGSRDIGVTGEWKLTLDGEDVGGVLLDEVIDRTDG